MSKKLIAIMLSLGIVFSLVLSGCHTVPSKKNQAETSAVQQLRVDSCRLVNENDDTVQLTGMSSHGLLWYPEYTNANALKTLKSYGANTFRIAIYADDAGGGYVQRKEETMRLTQMKSTPSIAPVF